VGATLAVVLAVVGRPMGCPGERVPAGVELVVAGFPLWCDNTGMLVFLETERLLLRQFDRGDADLLVELDGDPRVMRYITGGPPTPRDEVEGEVLPAFLSYYPRFPGYGFWAAIEKSTGNFLGWFHYRPAPDAPHDEPELGYRIRFEAWGKGYGTEGSRALIAKGFNEFDVQRVVASTMAVNTASRRVMEKSGMRFVRAFVAEWPVSIPGDEHGDVEYAICRSEWEEQRAGVGWSATRH
jgi:RimJ/RimL family protein N-acetyltransferase